MPITSLSTGRRVSLASCVRRCFAADLVLIPVQPSPLGGWASAEMLALLAEACRFSGRRYLGCEIDPAMAHKRPTVSPRFCRSRRETDHDEAAA